MALIKQPKDNVIQIDLYYREIKDKYGHDQVVIIDDEEEAKSLVKLNEEKKKQYEEDLKKYNQNQKISQENRITSIKEPERDFEDIFIVRTVWKKMTWFDQNNITERSASFNDSTGMQLVDFWKFRDLKLKTCLVKWDLKDEKGIDVELTAENIDSLPYEAVIYLLREYDKRTVLDNDERKK